MYNILVGGAAGQGIDTTVANLEVLLKKAGYYVFTIKDFMSRVRGGHNFSLIRFGNEIITSHSNELDGMIALDDDTVELHKQNLKQDGFILCDTKLTTTDPKAIKLNMGGMAKELGNVRVSGSIAIGVILKLFGIATDHVEETMKNLVKEAYLDMNVKAVRLGYESVETRFSITPGNFSDWMIISGSKSLALGAIAAGIKFYSAYPMSPSTAIMEYLASKSVEADFVVEQAEDEIAAINMAIGASYAGARAMTGTSGGGFCLKVEALGLSGIAEIPLVAVNVQRPGPATGLPTRTEQSDLKFVISAAQGEFPRMVIALRNHKDAFYQTIRAFDITEKYQIPVIILSDQYLGDSTATVEPFDISNIKIANPSNDEYKEGEYLRYQLTENGISPRLIPGKSRNFVSVDSDEHDERGFITESADVRNQMMDKRMKKLELLREELLEPEFFGEENCETLFLGWGSTYGPIAEAVSILNEDEPGKYGALSFGDVYPLPTKLLMEKASKAKQIVNIEQNATGQLKDLIREQTGILCTGSILKYDGRQISGEEIVEKIRKGGQK
ncbi:2-oxoacid:acceptor oxidoreductase subunit alpha [Lachnoclostridium phytofermentans]|uniref:Pyruvate flavodoxin/ferredoxin oxidoreductase domain protein n=1 Tax=Lachnoclostridium phytofermentans (strain ATCC 700394 / DSM 18823 / ISDg) TaxID=357809 RepID=A9KR00_LACP7|nr:2-oxoacid:acceptor oxidoreductase subunit alpha [Lachnoclostridium phytofermentans]ABX43479.1 pyruvate flavodoxin/ferredoxin oxidoreductase domain protein [Lachnoclostridium phytofermentans ISDg]